MPATPDVDPMSDPRFARAMEMLRGGRVADAHRVFAEIATTDVSVPFVGDALAASIPDSLLVKPAERIVAGNADYMRDRLESLRDAHRFRLLLLDLSENTYLSAAGVDLLAHLQTWPGIVVNLVAVHPRAQLVLDRVRMPHLIWTELSCPVCGPTVPCLARFGRRRALELRSPEPALEEGSSTGPPSD
jgi:anti-anti-sigma regulatory factor